MSLGPAFAGEYRPSAGDVPHDRIAEVNRMSPGDRAVLTSSALVCVNGADAAGTDRIDCDRCSSQVDVEVEQHFVIEPECPVGRPLLHGGYEARDGTATVGVAR